jgi:hypothetical protein
MGFDLRIEKNEINALRGSAYGLKRGDEMAGLIPAGGKSVLPPPVIADFADKRCVERAWLRGLN